MSFKLIIEFDGLCVFVPTASCDQMSVLLINALGNAMPGMPYPTPGMPGMPGPMPGMPGPMYMAPHYPFLSFDLAQQWKLADYDLASQGGRAASFFRWEDLEILPGGNPPVGIGLQIETGRRPGTAEPTGPGEDHDFSWVPALDQIVPGGSKIDPAVLDENPPRNLVMGRVGLTSGKIGTGLLVRSGRRNVIFEFRGQKSGYSTDYCQALASRVRYSLQIHDPFVELKFTHFGDRILGAQAYRSIKLAPKVRPNVEVYIRNLTLEEVLGLPPRATGGVQQDHFTRLYSVLEDPPDDLPIPQPLSAPDLQGGPAHGSDTLCLGGSATR
jgi:hypothetical protein